MQIEQDNCAYIVFYHTLFCVDQRERELRTLNREKIDTKTG